MLIAKQKKVLETFNGKRVPKQSCWHAGCFDNVTVKKNLPWLRKQTARSLKIRENEAFFTRAVYSNICLHWYKAIKKKTLIEILTRHSEHFSHNVRENFKRWEFFCEISSSLENPLEILIAVSRNLLEKLGQKSNKKVTQNWKAIENSWHLRIEVDQSKQTSAQKIGIFQNPGNEFPPDNEVFFPQKPKLNEKQINSTQQFILGTYSSWHVDWNADKRIEHFCPKRLKLSSTDAITFNTEINNLPPKLLSRQKKCCFESPVENRSPKV